MRRFAGCGVDSPTSSGISHEQENASFGSPSRHHRLRGSFDPRGEHRLRAIRASRSWRNPIPLAASGRYDLPRLGSERVGGTRCGNLQRVERNQPSVGERGQRLLVGGHQLCLCGRAVQVCHHWSGQHRLEERRARAPVDQLGWQLDRGQPERVHLDHRQLHDAQLERACHLRDAPRYLRSVRQWARAGDLRQRQGQARLPQGSRHQCGRAHADLRVSWQRFLGLQPFVSLLG